MSRIEVPQELTKKIIHLYNQGKTRKAIKKELNLPFGDSVVKRLLEENNIEIRSNPGAKAGGRKKQEVSKKIQEQIIDLYVNKEYGLDRIVEELKLPFSFDKVKSILRENNIHIRNVKEAHQIKDTTRFGNRKYNLNDDYNLESHNGMWFLGFFAADGYLPKTKGAKHKIVIELAEKDRDVLELIKKEFEFEGPIHLYNQSLDEEKFKKVSLSMTSKKLREKIESYGIRNGKTYGLNHLPNIPQEYMLDFIRGFFDGDGSIYAKDSRFNMSITSYSKNFVEEINETVHKLLPLDYEGSVSQDHNNWSIKWGKNDSEKIAQGFYDNPYLALPRKKKKYLLFRK